MSRLLRLLTASLVASAMFGANPARALPIAPYIAPPYTCTTNYYVSKTGSDSNDGSAASPWLTIQHAVDALGPGSHGGVCIYVGDGVYTESVHATGVDGSADTRTGYLVFRSQHVHGATVQVPLSQATNYGSSFGFTDSCYVVVDGFNLVGDIVPGSLDHGFFATRSSPTSPPSHHFKVLNCIIHDHGAGGISLTYSDYIDAEGNVIYDNANTSHYEESGFSTWHAVAFDQKPGFHNIVADNVVYDNAEVNDGDATHTDGNGIILDDLRDSDGIGPHYGPYTAASLVENNLVFGNGGGGVHLYETDYVTVRNNTAFDNYIDPLNTGTWRGDINADNAGHNTFVNNIGVANPAANTHNTAFADDSDDGSNIGNVWIDNLSFDGTSGDPSVNIGGSPSTITSANGNILGRDPLFTDLANDDFTLKAESPALGAGTKVYGIPSIDLAGRAAEKWIDLGAYEFASVTASSR